MKRNRPTLAYLPASILLLTGYPVASARAVNVSGAANGVVNDDDAGWTWSGFSEYDDPSCQGGTAHAGGPGDYAVYSFHGTGVEVYVLRAPSVTVDGRTHRMGSMRVSIDDHVKAAPSVRTTETEYGYKAFDFTGLSNAIHVLKIDPQDGWVVVDYIKILSGDSPSIDGATDASSTSKTASTPGPPVIVPEGNYRIYPAIAPASDLDDKDWITTDGNPIQIWSNSNNHQQNQWFHVTPVEQGEYWMAPLNATTEALTTLQPLNDNTIPAGIWHFTQLPAQLWIATETDDGWSRLSPSNLPDLCLSVVGGRGTDGTRVDLEPWRNLKSQKWQFGIQ